MLVVIFGTTGELIKLAPVLRRLDDRGLEYLTISTNQQVTQIPGNQRDLGLRPTDINISNGRGGRDLETMSDIPAWLAHVVFDLGRNISAIRSRALAAGGRGIVLVHGDTLTTVIGAVVGRILGLPVAHLEAGMRSHRWNDPFPEELDRRLAGRLATVHYANTETEIANLRAPEENVVRIGANTVLDAINLVPEKTPSEVLRGNQPSDEYGILSIHRNELLEDRAQFLGLLETVGAKARSVPIGFIDHPITVAAIRKHGLQPWMRPFVRMPRQRYGPFIALLRGSAFMVTDSGGSQEECFYLDIPCLVHRQVTERTEGIGRNVVLSGFDLEMVSTFLSNPQKWRTGARPSFPSPSDIVVDDLVRRGVWS